MQNNPVDLRTSAHNSPALGGLAASPAQFARGSTPSPWIPAHAAALVIVGARDFYGDTPACLSPALVLVQREAPEGAPLAGKASGAKRSEVTPVGNTGGTFNRSVTRG